jgi:hypothetical protein
VEVSVKHHLAALLVLVAAATGCGKSSPASPSLAGGATIAGSVVANGAGGGGNASGIVVSVAGTTLSATADGSGRFSLSGVPRGDAILQFTAPGVNASVGVASVETDETISVVVSLTGSTAVLESQRRQTGNQEQLEGRVESLPPTTAPKTLVVAGRTIATNDVTQFLRGGAPVTFADLVIGVRVHVTGRSSGGSLLASLVEIQNTNADLPVEINGLVAQLTGTSAQFQFEVDGRLIKGDALTEFFGGSAFGDLANGRRVEVKGQQRDGFVYASRIHVNADDDDDDDGDQDESASIEGPLTSRAGTAPALTLLVGGVTVRTSGSTDVQRRGDRQDLSTLAIGMTLHVVGVRQPDGSLDARLIQIKDDAVGGLFEIEGSAGGVHGTCPSLTFGVNGFSIVTNGSTAFTPACAQLRSGNKVKVKGVVQSGGTILASSVEKQ